MSATEQRIITTSNTNTNTDAFNTPPSKCFISPGGKENCRLEILFRKPVSNDGHRKIPVLLLPDIFHSAEVYSFNLLSVLASNDFFAYSLSYRSHGGSSGKTHSSNLTIRHYLRDITSAINFILDSHSTLPYVISHGVSSVILAKWLSKNPSIKFPGYVFIAPVNFIEPQMYYKRLARVSKGSRIKCYFTGTGRTFVSNVKQINKLFFTQDTPLETCLDLWNTRCIESRRVLKGIGKIRDKGKELIDSPLLLVGGKRDVLVKQKDIVVMGSIFKVDPVWTEEAHDLFLDVNWRTIGEVICNFLIEVNGEMIGFTPSDLKDPRDIVRERIEAGNDVKEEESS